MNPLKSFADVSDAELDELGGKGRNLVLLTRGGFPVPGGFVVPAACYRQWVASIDWFDPHAHAFSYDQPDVVVNQSAALRERLASAPVDPELVRQITSKLVAWPAGSAAAVRSSSTFEDLGEAAFAGQHDTYLNCVGADEVVEKLRSCWISLWTDRAILYRHSRGFRHADASMAVVVQQQVRAEVAGVAFSIHPVTGNLDTATIDANYGLGESVVSGDFAVDHFEVDKTSRTITSRQIANKERCIRPTANGTEEAEVDSARRDQPCLDDAQILRVADLATRVEAYYSWPQDTEWAMAGGELLLLQARPVTIIPPRWTRDESAERFPQPFTPLSWDFVQTGFRRSLAHSLRLMGLPGFQGDWFDKLGQYIYGNQNAVEVIRRYRPVRARTIDELSAELPVLRERYANLIELPARWMRDLDRYLLQIGELRSFSYEGCTATEIWQHLSRVVQVGEEYFLPNIAISMTQGFLHGVLHGLVQLAVGPELALKVLDGLLSGVETKTVEVNTELYALAQMAHADASLEQLLASVPSERIVAERRLETFPEFAAALNTFLEHHGHRELAIDYFVPTWIDCPWIVLDLLNAIPADAAKPADTSNDGRRRYSETELKVLAVVPDDIRYALREVIRLARVYTLLDDLEHYQTTRINPLARQAALALGAQLVDEGILASWDDVFFFRRAELERIVGGERSAALIEAGRKRRREFEEAGRTQPDWNYGQQTEAALAEGAMRGIPGSPGEVEAAVFVVDRVEQFKEFPRGAILVARTTNPAWTPLFYQAAGLVTDSGGPLSHGAVTAREMGLPAVMAVAGATTRLKTGQRVRVNGSAGSVEVLSD
ncbi:MAG TPA: PEP/pyruvate-binding domain-containing protein [Pirellulales bacterium]|nr:PEP/pyruvate-binding domain-containing protein [Pirellulales bacterium]